MTTAKNTARLVVPCIKLCLRRQDGAISVLLAAMLIVVLSVISMSVDYGRQVRLAAAMQSALDAAVLSASAADLDDTVRQDRFNAIFQENYDIDESLLVTLDFTYSATDGGHGTATYKIPSTFSAVLGKDNLRATINSYADMSLVDIEVVMVLDVSGSMRANMGAQSRLDALKSAAKKLVDTLETNKKGNQSIKYAIVPFTMNVNVGTSNTAFVTNTNHSLFTGTAWAGCVLERPGSFTNDDTYNSAAAAAGGGKWHAYIWPPEPNDNNQCINPSDGTNSGYQTVETVGTGGTYDPWTKGPNYNCVRLPVVELTDSATDIETEIDKLESHSNMGTIIAPGVAWGHRILSPEEPFAEGADFGDVRKIMVVITDGQQTTEGPYQSGTCTADMNTSSTYQFNPATFDLDGDPISTNGPRDMFSPYGYMYDSAPTGGVTANWDAVDDAMEAMSLDACSQFKNRDPNGESVQLYTIAASTSAGAGTSVYDLLQQCATDSEHFFYAEDAATLEQAFETIAKKASNLRLTQ